MMNYRQKAMWSSLLEVLLKTRSGLLRLVKLIMSALSAAQWLLQAPGATNYMGSIGKDKYGEEMKKNSKLAGLKFTITRMSLHQQVPVLFALWVVKGIPLICVLAVTSTLLGGVHSCNRGREQIMDVITRENAKEDERKAHKTVASASRCGMLELPLPLIFDILVRLPNRAKISCKSVCKTFREVFRDPYFSEDLTKPSSLPPRLVIHHPSETCSELCTFHLVNLFDLEGTSDIPERRARSRAAYAAPTNQYQFTSGNGFMLVGSCNGLVCLMPYVYCTPMSVYYICNPLLGELIVTPPVTQEIPDHTYTNFSRFVFSSKTRQYKIVHFRGRKNFSSDPPRPIKVEIYTMGCEFVENHWASTASCIFGNVGHCINGILHLVTKTKKVARLICSLDIDTEKFQHVAPPAQLSSYFYRKYYTNVGVRNGCLCLCYYADKDCTFEVWVMKDYGVAESWTMEFNIDLMWYDFLFAEDFRVLISFMENGDMLFLRNDNFLVSYNHRSETFKWYKPLRYGTVCAYSHAPSLISLKVIADGKCADSVKQIRKAGFGWIGYLDYL